MIEYIILGGMAAVVLYAVYRSKNKKRSDGSSTIDDVKVRPPQQEK